MQPASERTCEGRAPANGGLPARSGFGEAPSYLGYSRAGDVCILHQMADDYAILRHLASFLNENEALAGKVRIRSTYELAEPISADVRVGDDCAAIPDGEDWLLFAAKGMPQAAIAEDPWLAGYCAVLMNISDVAAMGGRPIAVVDVLSTPSLESSDEIWSGMSAAARAYGVPVVGGHTMVGKTDSATLAASVIGRAKRLLTSFDARAGDDLLFAVDLRGSWQKDKPFWNASVGAPNGILRDDLELLPALAESGLCKACRDVGNGGIVGTVAMLLECSSVGAELWLDKLPQPPGGDLGRWLVACPTYGYVLSVPPENSERVMAHFTARDIVCEPVGRVTSSPSLVLCHGAARRPFLLVGA